MSLLISRRFRSFSRNEHPHETALWEGLHWAAKLCYSMSVCSSDGAISAVVYDGV